MIRPDGPERAERPPASAAPGRNSSRRASPGAPLIEGIDGCVAWQREGAVTDRETCPSRLDLEYRRHGADYFKSRDIQLAAHKLAQGLSRRMHSAALKIDRSGCAI